MERNRNERRNGEWMREGTGGWRKVEKEGSDGGGRGKKGSEDELRKGGGKWR